VSRLRRRRRRSSDVARNAPIRRIPLAIVFVALVVAVGVAPTALADKGGKGGGKSGGSAGNTPTKSEPASSSRPPAGSTCGSLPRASITNTWAWGASGSWGFPGQQLAYHILVFNDDVNCGSSTYAVSLSAPDGFAVSVPQTAITLSSASSGYLWAYVTSPQGVADGSYPLTLTVTRAGTTSPAGTSTSYYKLYSSDVTPPRLYYPNPWDGATISGRSYSVGVASNDDHAVKRIELYIDRSDGPPTSSSSCDNISYECRLSYSWAIRRVHGQHTVTFKSYDWMGNVGSLTTTFTVN
jgi:hypothetical protein